MTGCLVYHHRTFIQVIEGEKEMIKGLFKTNSSDPRHSQVDLIWEEEISERGFTNWTLASIEIDNQAMQERFMDLLDNRDAIVDNIAHTTAKALLLNMRELLQ